MTKKIISVITTFLIIILIGYFVLKIIIPKEITIEVSSSPKDIQNIHMLKDIIVLKTKEIEKIDTTEINNYTVNYHCQYLFIPINQKIEIKVKDTIPPEFENFENKVEIYQNEDYIEPDYSVTDNYSNEEDIIVEITGNIDTSTIGDYYLKYIATDTSGNKKEITRKISVIKKVPIDINALDYNLSDYFPETILKETSKAEESYMNNIYLVGDSVYRNFINYDVYNSSKVWAGSCINPENIYIDKIQINKEKIYTIPELITNNKPEYIVLNIGTCQLRKGEAGLEDFIKQYTKFLTDIKKTNPNTKIIVQTLVPIIDKESTKYINNSIRRKYNYYITEMCSNLDIKVLDVTNIFIDNNGNIKEELYLKDGHHPNEDGLGLIIEYIKTHKYQ